MTAPETLTTTQGRQIAYHKTEGDGPCVVFLGGFKSDMAGTKAVWLEDWCRDRGRAEDMVQEALLKVYRSLGQWRGESTLSTWLVAVATNAFRSHLRRRGGEPAVPEPADRASEPEDESGEPLRERVRRAVTALPARYRDAIVLYYFHGLDVRAAAASLGCPEGTLKARLARGRRLLEPLLRAAAAMEDS